MTLMLISGDVEQAVPVTNVPARALPMHLVMLGYTGGSTVCFLKQSSPSTDVTVIRYL